VVSYLEGIGLTRPSDRPATTLTVLPGRNENVLVATPGGTTLLVKQGAVASSHAAPGPAIEAAVLQHLSGGQGGETVPAVRSYDDERDVLVVETLPEATDLWTRVEGTRRIPAAFGAQVGSALAWLHARPIEAAGAGVGDLPRLDAPFVFELPIPTIDRYVQMSAATVTLVRLLQSDPAIGALLNRLGSSWRRTALIHNDVKFENVLIPRGPAGAARRLQLIDFEMAGIGDPAWDLGAAFASHLVAWIRSMPVELDAPAGSADLAAAARLPIEATWPSVRALWGAYLGAQGGPAADRPGDLLARSVAFAGARTIQAAYELSQPVWLLDARAVLMAQVGANVVRDPSGAAATLLGLDG
jgi:hypothetical protein